MISGRSKVSCVACSTNITTNKLQWYPHPSAIVVRVVDIVNPLMIVCIVDCRLRGEGGSRVDEAGCAASEIDWESTGIVDEGTCCTGCRGLVDVPVVFVAVTRIVCH